MYKISQSICLSFFICLKEILYFPPSNAVRWVETHSVDTNKGTEIQNRYVTARGVQSQESGQWPFIMGRSGWNHC